MSKQQYTPDRTWKNFLTMFRSKNNCPVVLSCKACPNGVSPKFQRYSYIFVTLCNALAIIFFFLFRNYIYSFVETVTPLGWSNQSRALIVLLLAVLLFYIFLPILVLSLSFHFMKWVPANTGNDPMC